MKLLEGGLVVIAILTGLVILGGFSHKFIKYITKDDSNNGQDNIIEEMCEMGIEKVTGINIDLTPGSPEKIEVATKPQEKEVSAKPQAKKSGRPAKKSSSK